MEDEEGAAGAMDMSMEPSPEVPNSATMTTFKQVVELLQPPPPPPPPPHMQLSTKNVPAAKYSIIEINQNCFHLNRFGQVCSIDAAAKKTDRSVKKIRLLDALLDVNNNKEQQVFALREAMFNKAVRANCVNAGLLVLDLSFILNHEHSSCCEIIESYKP